MTSSGFTVPPHLTPGVKQTAVTGKPRRMVAKWTVESQEEYERGRQVWRRRNPIEEIVKRIKIAAGIPIPTLEDELTATMAKEIKDEVDKEIVNDLKALFGSSQEQ